MTLVLATIPQGVHSKTAQNRVCSRARPCRISTIRQKRPHKIYVAASNGVKKNRPKDKYYFVEMKYLKTSLTMTLI